MLLLDKYFRKIKSIFRKTVHHKAFGLDISDFSIEVLKLKRKKKKILIDAYGRSKLEPGIIDNGQIINPTVLTQAIKRAVEDAGIKSRFCIVSLPESKVFTHMFFLDEKLSLEKIKEFIERESPQIIPFNLKNLYYDYQIILKGKGMEIFFASASKKVVDDFKEVILASGLDLVALDMESQSLARALIESYNKGEAVMIIDIGARTTIISIFDEYGLRLSEISPIAGNKFTQSISEGLNVSYEDAEDIKKKYGLNKKYKDDKLLLILERDLQLILEEIKKAIRYFEKESGEKIVKIILAGGSSLMPGLNEYFGKNIDVFFEIGHPWIKIRGGKLPQERESVFYSTVAGLALRGIEPNPGKAGINLLRT